MRGKRRREENKTKKPRYLRRYLTGLLGAAMLLGSITAATPAQANLTVAEGSVEDLSAGTITHNYEYIGFNDLGPDTALFNQTGGTNTVNNNLYLGFYSGADGRYNLSNGVLSSYLEYIGWIGTGLFDQSGGTNTANYLTLGYYSGADGTYNLSNTGSLTTTTEFIGLEGKGIFTQTGGTNTVNNNLHLGYYSIGDGTYNLGSGDLSSTSEYIGRSGTGLFNQSGGTNTSTILYLGSGLTGDGTYNLSNTGSLSTTSAYIGLEGTGIFTQTGGTNTVNNNLTLGHKSTADGTYNLSSGVLSSSKEEIGLEGTGIFNQTGGTNTVTSNLFLGYYAGSDGTYNLSSGDLSATSEYIGRSSTGIFTQSGGTNTVTDTMTIAQYASATGEYNLQGGTLNVQNGTGTAEIINNDTFNYSGGALNVDTFTNNDEFNISGTGIRIINGDVVNNAGGTVKTTDTIAQFTGTFTNNGAYISDPSDNYFVDLIINSGGHVVGGAGDNFYVRNNLENRSTQNTDWNTTEAYLGFQSGADNLHDYYLAGADLGLNLAGYTDNFAWGTMEIDADNELHLFDGNAVTGGALYLKEILGVVFSGLDVSNIYGGTEGLNIYYLSGQAGNNYLGGLTYNLIGGGQLMAIDAPGAAPVPEPSTYILLGSGIAGLIFWRRKKTKKKAA